MGQSLTLEESKRVGLDVLDEISRVCGLLNINFYLAYGTLLGAIRHKGYIPWDDDLDIWMFRKDYELFKIEFNKCCKPEFRLWTYDNRDDYPYLMTKVMSMRTEIREKYFKTIPNFGIWVDIFPLDYVSEETRKAIPEMIKLEHRRWCALFKQSTFIGKTKLFLYNLIQNDTSFKDFKEKPIFFSKRIHELHSCIQPYEEIKSPTSENSIKNLFYTAKDFDSFMIVPFEDRLYPIPSGYDNLLKTIYGDYMKYPPLAKQKLDKHFMKIKWR